jgi:hypothetical protein
MTKDAVDVVVFGWRIRHTIATRNGWIGTSRRRVGVIVGLWIVDSTTDTDTIARRHRIVIVMVHEHERSHSYNRSSYPDDMVTTDRCQEFCKRNRLYVGLRL